MSTSNDISAIILEFKGIADSIVGVCFDSFRGFELNVREIIRFQQERIRDSANSGSQESNLQLLDSAWLLYGAGDPNDPNAKLYHQTTQGQFKARNSQGGFNHIFVANMGVIAIYQYWEDEYRGRIANVLNVEKDNVLSDVFGDMRIIRRSIIHHGSIADQDIERCKILRWFKPGDTIVIDRRMFSELLNHLAYPNIVVGEVPAQKLRDLDRDANAS
jgi:hypothetical protein